MLVRIDNQQPWNGEPLDAVRYPLNVQDLWTKDELNAIGLAPVQRFGVPEGKIASGEPWYTITDGIAIEHYDAIQSPPPTMVSDRQFFQALALMGLITNEEALAAVKTGDIPLAMQTALDALPSDQRFNALMLLSGATIFERNHPMTLLLGQTLGWDASAIDNLFRQAGAL